MTSRTTIAIAGALALLACGGPQSRADEPQDEAHRTDWIHEAAHEGHGAPTSECTGVCVEGATCTAPPIGWSCGCVEHPDVNCGGAPRRLGPSTWAWTCTPSDPATDRGDGCPYGAPTEAAACGAPPRTCRYADSHCGYSGIDATCEGGLWHLVPYAMPPPP